MKAIQAEHIEEALGEARKLGRIEFRTRYGFKEARQYVLLDSVTGHVFDSKAVVGVAYGLAHPDEGPKDPADFSGGLAGAVRVLEELGYSVLDRPSTAWSFLSVDDPQHRGNAGYADHVGRIYAWDSTVANHSKPRAGDFAVLRDSDSVLGSGWIEAINQETGVKERFRCPQCGKTGIKERTTLRPKYRCDNKHEFETPSVERVEVTKYQADFSKSWVGLAEMPVKPFEETIASRAFQHSIRESDLDAALELLGREHSLLRVDPPPSTEGRPSGQSGAVPPVPDPGTLREIGERGEALVLAAEQDSLRASGHPDLAEKVEWVARTRGPAAGYDVLSFTESGQDRYIEVKTTRAGAGTPFFISSAEVRFGAQNAERYAIHRVFGLEANPRYFVLPGDPHVSCDLEPVTFRARVRNPEQSIRAANP